MSTIVLTESQKESFELLYASICNSLVYAEDLLKHNKFREPMAPMVTKLKWLKTAIELRIPEDRRKSAREGDHLFYDELLRYSTHMDDKDKQKLEKFINSL
jgi:hypothetical protein